MNLSTLKLAVFVAVVVVSFGLILTDVCLFGRRECFPNLTKLKNTLVDSLERLSFLEDTATYKDESVLESPGLNHHVWENNCVKTIETLCNFPIFPKAPDRRQIIFRTEIIAPQSPGVDGHRLIGYLLPDLSGEYHFAVVSNGFSEVWLSPIKSWTAAKQVAYISPQDVPSTIKKWDFESVKSQISTRIYLKARKPYFIEIIYSVGARKTGENFLQVAWKRPGKSMFEIIEGESLSLYTNDSKKAQYKMFDDELPEAHCCAKYRKGYANKYMRRAIYPNLENTVVNKALGFCDYRPSYLLGPDNFHGLSNFKLYNGVQKYVLKTTSFPYPNIDGVVRNQRSNPAFWAENPLAEQEARSVVERYMEAIGESYPGKYELKSIFRVEKKEDPKKGSRYFLELVVKDLTTGSNYILAEYVFLPKGENGSLCYPKGLQWDRTADVYLILTAKNLGRWVHHFIKNVEQIVQETNDEQLHVVIFDFNSPDIDLEQAFKRSTLKNYHFIRQPGNYSRTVSLSRAVQSIQNSDAIFVTVDLHLDIGSQLINDIRKHCSKGKTVYAPQIVFLNCGGSSALPRGVWYHYSYGTIAMYKEDWVRFGGFSKRFVNKITWGGEDWDIIDGAVKGGLEIERKRCPWIYHYHHTKVGMWSKGHR